MSKGISNRTDQWASITSRIGHPGDPGCGMPPRAFEARNGHVVPFGEHRLVTVTPQIGMLGACRHHGLGTVRLCSSLVKRVGFGVRLTLVRFPRPLFSRGRPWASYMTFWSSVSSFIKWRKSTYLIGRLWGLRQCECLNTKGSQKIRVIFINVYGCLE